MIEVVKGRHREFRKDSYSFYRFVTQPGPFNFVDTPHKGDAKSTTPSSSLGKRKRKERRLLSDYDGELFANEYASTSCDEDSFTTPAASEGASEREGGSGGLRVSVMELGSPVKQRCGERSAVGGTSVATGSSVVGGSQNRESLVARVSKELTLNR